MSFQSLFCNFKTEPVNLSNSICRLTCLVCTQVDSEDCTTYENICCRMSCKLSCRNGRLFVILLFSQFKAEFQLPNPNMFVRSVHLKIGIHEIHKIQQMYEIYLPKSTAVVQNALPKSQSPPCTCPHNYLLLTLQAKRYHFRCIVTVCLVGGFQILPLLVWRWI